MPRVGAFAGDAEDLGDVGIVEEAGGRRQDLDRPLLDAPVALVNRLAEATGRVPFPADGAEEVVGSRRRSS